MKNKINILGVYIDQVSTQETMQIIENLAMGSRKSLITYVNAHCINVARRDKVYREILNGVDLLYPDGIGIIWASAFLERKKLKRVTATEFLPDFCKKCENRNLRFFFLGGLPGVIEKTVENLKKIAPQLKVVGINHGYFKREEESSLLNKINSAKPHILIVGMEVPKQEKWIANNFQKLSVNVCWAVGGAFDFYSGQKKKAPPWMNTFGLEWFFRLIQEPRRLWKRYLIGNTIFIWLILKEFLKIELLGKKNA